MRRQLSFFIFGSILIAASSLAGDHRTLDWQEVMNLARSQNSDIQQQNQTVRSQLMSSRATLAGLMPQISAYANRANSELEVLGINSRDKSTEIGARLTYSLFNGFSSVGAVWRSEALFRKAEIDRTLVTVDLRYRLRISYFGALIAQERLQLARKILERDKLNLNLLKLKYQAGAEALWSVQQAEAEIANSDLSLKDEENELLRSEADLRQLLNLSANDPLTIAPDPSALNASGVKADAEDLSRHPKFSLAQADLDAAHEDVRIAYAGFYPQVSVQYEKGKKYPDGSSNTVSTTRWGLSVTFNLFEGLSTYHLTRSARYQHAALEIRLANEKRELLTQIETAERDLKVKLARIPISHQILMAAQARAKTVGEQYKVGLKNFLEWEQAENRLAEAEKQEINAKWEAYQARAEWEKARGESLL